MTASRHINAKRRTFTPGMKFGRLTLLRRVRVKKVPYGLCLCECGKKVRRPLGSLGRNNFSCGCLKHEIAVRLGNKLATAFHPSYRVVTPGMTFGRLTVDAIVPGPKHDNSMAICTCVCGNKSKVIVSALGKKTKSCGCLLSEISSALRRGKDPIKALQRRLVNMYRTSARVRSLPWGLTEEECLSLTRQPCTYCGLSNTNVIRGRGKHIQDELPYNGIDRIDNKLGYIVSNCTPCCRRCNVGKSTMSLSDFTDWVMRVSSHLRKTA